MKKAIIAVVALLAAAGISIGAFVAVKNKSEKEAEQSRSELADNVLFTIDDSSINRIEIKNTDGEYILEYIDEKWKMTDSSDDIFELNQTAIQAICANIANLTADTKYGDLTDENKVNYGLESPYVITIYDNEASHTLYMGSESPTGSFYYGYTGEKSGVYAIPSANATEIIKSKMDLKNTDLIPYDTNEIKGIMLKRDGRTILDLNYDDEANVWRLPDEYKVLVIDQTVITSQLTLLTRLTAEEIYPESEDDIKTFGFDRPNEELTLKSSDGSEITLLTSKYGQGSNIYTHVYNTSSKQVGKYYAADLSIMTYDIKDLLITRFEFSNMYNTSSVSFESEDISVQFDIDTGSSTVKCGDKIIDISDATLGSYFRNFYESFTYQAIYAVDINAEPDISESVLTVNYVQNDGTKVKADWIPTEDPEEYYLMINDIYTGTRTSDQVFIGEDSAFTTYEILCRQAGL